MILTSKHSIENLSVQELVLIRPKIEGRKQLREKYLAENES